MNHENNPSESTPLLAADIVTDDEGQQTRNCTRLAHSYRRPSFVSGGGRGFILATSPIPESALRDDEAFDCVREERGLLQRSSIGFLAKTSRRGSVSEAVADVEDTWEEAVKSKKVKTSWRYELGVLIRYSVIPLRL